MIKCCTTIPGVLSYGLLCDAASFSEPELGEVVSRWGAPSGVAALVSISVLAEAATH